MRTCSIVLGLLLAMSVLCTTIDAGDAAGPGSKTSTSRAVATSASQDDPLRKGLIAWWSGDGDAKDSTGKHDGTICGNVRFVAGRHDKAFELGQDNSYVDFGDHEDFRVGDGLSVAMWVCPRKLDEDRVILGKNHNAELMLGIASTGHVWAYHGLTGNPSWQHFMFSTAGGVDHNTNGAGGAPAKSRGTTRSLKVGQWTHVVYVRDPKTVRWYIDGELLIECDNGVPVSATGSEPLALGRNGAMQRPPFIGLVDEVAIWQRALSADDVMDVYLRPNLSSGLLSALAPRVQRPSNSDIVYTSDGRTMSGQIQTASFVLKAACGEVEVPLARMAAIVPNADGVWMLLEGGQALKGRLSQERIRIKSDADGTVDVDISKIRQCVWQARPDGKEALLPRIALTTGEVLDCKKLPQEMTFESSLGKVKVPTSAIREAQLTGKDRYRVRLLNSAGFVGMPAEALKVQLELGPALEVKAGQLYRMERPEKASDGSDMATIRLVGGEIWRGLITNSSITLKTPPKSFDIPVDHIRQLVVANDKVTVDAWGGQSESGRIEGPDLEIELSPSVSVKVAWNKVSSIARPLGVPADIRRRIDALIDQLGAESFKERQAAFEALKKMGPEIAPFLELQLNNPDAEISYRIRQILEEFSPKAPETVPTPVGPQPGR